MYRRASVILVELLFGFNYKLFLFESGVLIFLIIVFHILPGKTVEVLQLRMIHRI